MQDIVTNLRGTRAFDRAAGKAVTLALASSVLVLATGTLLAAAAPRPAAIRIASRGTALASPQPVKMLTEDAAPTDVSLDFVAADISDVLKALALQTHANIVSGPDVTGNVTVSLAHVSLEDALNMISHLSGFQYAKVGSTYVVGTAASLASLTTPTEDAAPINAILPFNFSDPTQLTQIITDRFPNVKVTEGKAIGTGSKGILVVTGQPSDIDAVRQLVSDTEQGLSRDIASSTTYVYNIKYASADDLVQILNRLVPNLIVTPGPSMRIAPVAPSTADAGGVTSTTTSYGATGAGGATGAMTGGTVTSVTGDLPTKPTTMSLLLTGSDTDIARAQQVLAQVDTRPAQINFSATIADLDNNLARSLGLTYGFAGAQTTVGQVTSSGATPSTTQFRTNLPIGYTPLSQFVNIGLQAAENNGYARILASPNISAINGQPAAIFIGNNITYVSSITTGPTGQNVTTATASAGVKLFITGQVNNDGYITVNLHPEVSTLTLTPTIGGAQLPNIATREATTTLRVRNGDYIAIGGLAQNQVTKTISGVPILDNIPIIGSLFRSDSTTRERRVLTIFIKVSIQKNGQAAITPAPAMP